MSDQKGEQTIHLSNSNNKGTAVAVSFKGDGSVHIHSNGPVTVNGSVMTLDAGEKGAITMHAKTITMVAEDDVKVSAKTKGVSVDAQENITFKSKKLAGKFGEEIALNAGAKARIVSPDSDVI